jgi:hypothetical protein
MTQPEFSFSTNDRTNRERVLDLLRDGRYHDTLEVIRVGGTRGPARIHELRERGYVIECVGERGRHRYRLLPQAVAPVVKLTRREAERLCAAWRAV